MTEPDEFDEFYRGTRDELLLQTYALTGDLPASSSAVRAAYVVAWHHWPKVSRVPDPETWVRERAWRQAQRRHTARLWHRDRKLDPEAKATLDSLGKLSLTQRKLLILNLLTGHGLAAMAREVALPRHEAEAELQRATAQFAVHRDVRTTAFRPLFDNLRQYVASHRWPRTTIIRRAGAARRRSHTLVGMVVAVGAVVGSRALVTDAAGSRPTLLGGEVARHQGSHRPGVPHVPAPPAFSADALLTAGMVDGFLPGSDWSEQHTSNNLEGSGVRLPCQQASYASGRSIGALGRTFTAETPGRDAGNAPAAGQLLELSATPDAAGRTYRETVGWFAGCTQRRVQLISTHKVRDVGDEAVLLELRDWSMGGATYLAGVARSGALTSTTEIRLPPGKSDVQGAARLMAAAVNGVCGPLDGNCAGKPRISEMDPVPVGDSPALLLALDLPPVRAVHQPWVATSTKQAVDNVAATSCDKTQFTGAKISHAVTRTYLVPGAGLAAQFGLTETAGAMDARTARAFVAQVRQRMASCSDRDPGTDVTPVAHQEHGPREVSVWKVTSELDDKHSVTFFMGIVRRGTAVAQVGFVPSGHAVLAPGDFVQLVDRAGDRLPALPKPS